MEELKYIGELFRESLKGHKMEPSDRVWKNIQKNLEFQSGVKSTPKFTKYLIGGVAVVGIVASVAIAYFNGNHNVHQSSKSNHLIAENKELVKDTNPMNAIEPSESSPRTNANTPSQIPNRNVSILSLNNPDNNPNKDQGEATAPNFTNMAHLSNIPSQSAANTSVNDRNTKETTPAPNTRELITKPESGNNEKTSIILDISKDTMICVGESTTLKAKGGLSVLWSNGSTGDEIKVTAIVEDEELTYRATIQLLNGDTTITIKVKTVNCKPFEQPNAFTPNGDNNNDLFKLNLSPDIKDFSLMIFNRSGVPVFETKDVEQGWDGRYNNENMAEGAYFYILRYRDKAGSLKTIRGTVILLRP